MAAATIAVKIANRPSHYMGCIHQALCHRKEAI